jgi:hypothetical protein
MATANVILLHDGIKNNIWNLLALVLPVVSTFIEMFVSTDELAQAGSALGIGIADGAEAVLQ